MKRVEAVTRSYAYVTHMSMSNLLFASAFSFLLWPRGTIFEITTVLFSVFKDVAIFTICSVISSGVLSRVISFVPTYCI